MQFNVKFEQKETHNLPLKRFLGVDYATSVFNVEPYRATDMRNFININGINRKRNGWNEIAQFNDKINGYWEFKDKEKNTHKIVQSGTLFYRITNIGLNSFETTYEEISFNENVDITRIINDRSCAVVADDKLYILCGDYLVYGKFNNVWEIRKVEDDEQTYIPTTTIGIVNANSKIENTRTGYDKINMLNRRRRNKLIGESNNVELNINKKSDTYVSQFGGYIESVNNESYESLVSLKLNIRNDDTIYNTTNIFPLTEGLTTYIYDEVNLRNDFLTNGIGWFDGENGGDIENFFVYLSLSFQYANNTLYVILRYYYKAGKEDMIINLSATQELKYYLDTKNIDADPIKVYNYETLIDSSKYTIDRVEGSFILKHEYLPLIEGQSNITVEFSKYVSGYADRINKCRFGTLYGYNAGRDNLFLAGNPDFPNVDFYSSETYSVNPTFDNKLKNYGDFTYFPVNNYSVFGNEISEIMDYKMLGNGSQMVMKKAVGNEPTIFFRTSTLVDATDEYGNPIRALNRNYNYKEIVYPIQVGTIGEGCITRLGNANLSGDILMLSKNGVFGIQYGTNVVVDDKYAKERSRLIYGRLKDFDLSKAVSIVYDGRYYLAVGGEENLCFVADSRYKSNLMGDKQDTFNYEWWVWKNIPAYNFFIVDDLLSFGTVDGKICSFMENNYIDKSYSILELGSLTTEDNHINYDTNKFVINITYDNDVSKLTENYNNRFKPVSLGSPLFEVVEDELGQVHYKDTTLYGYVIKNIEDELGAFTLVDDLGNDVVLSTKDGSRPNITGYFMFCENVVNEWWTPVFDGGTIEYAKTIQKVIISPETTVGGEIEFGVETRKKESVFETKGVNLFSWDRLNFTNWSFETTAFPKSFVEKVKFKNCNYFRFFFRSKNDCDGAINQINVIFTIGKKNRGVN